MKRVLVIAVLGVISFGTAYAAPKAISVLKAEVAPAAQELAVPKAIVAKADVIDKSGAGNIALKLGFYHDTEERYCARHLALSADQSTIVSTAVSDDAVCDNAGIVDVFSRVDKTSTYVNINDEESTLIVFNDQQVIFHSVTMQNGAPIVYLFKTASNSANSAKPKQFASSIVVKDLDGPQAYCRGTQNMTFTYPRKYANLNAAIQGAYNKVRESLLVQCSKYWPRQTCEVWGMSQSHTVSYNYLSGIECGVPYDLKYFIVGMRATLSAPQLQ